MTDDVILASLLECKSNVTFHLVSYIYNALLSFDVNSYFRYPSRNSIRYSTESRAIKVSILDSYSPTERLSIDYSMLMVIIFM